MLTPYDDPETVKEFFLSDLEIECASQARQKRDGRGGNDPSPEKTRRSTKWTRRPDISR